MLKLDELQQSKKIRDLTIDELKREEKDLIEHIFKLRFQLASGQLKDPNTIRICRHGLARVKTILHEKITEQA